MINTKNTQVNPRKVAYEALLRVERGAYANLALKEALSAMPNGENSKRDSAFIAAMFYSVLEHKLTLKFYLESFTKKKVQNAVSCVIYLGMAQILYMGVASHAAINESVKLTRSVGKKDAASLVNAILRRTDREKDKLPKPEGSLAERLSIEYSVPVYIIERYLNRFGEDDTRALCCIRSKSDICMRPNSFKCDEAELEELLKEENISYRRGMIAHEVFYAEKIGDLSKWKPFTCGQIAVQGESSVLVSKLADVKPNMKILDACAAPGGKTAYLASKMRGGELHAWDLHEHRVELINKNCNRLGIDFVKASCHDASKYEEEFSEYFDLLLIDAPCSGLGVIAGKPDIKYTKSPEIISELSEIQAKILQNCSRYVAKGGSLVYSTCTIIEEENEQQIDRFLKNNPDFEADSIDFAFPSSFDKERLKNGCVQLLPNVDGVDGFFLARLKRCK